MNNNDLFLTKNNGKAACRAARGQSLASEAVFGQAAFTTHTHTHAYIWGMSLQPHMRSFCVRNKIGRPFNTSYISLTNIFVFASQCSKYEANFPKAVCVNILNVTWLYITYIAYILHIFTCKKSVFLPFISTVIKHLFFICL